MNKKIIETHSPDQWIERAGGFVDDAGRLHLPHKFLLVSMAAAAEAVEAFKKNDSLMERMKNVLIIAMSVRSADTAYYQHVVDMLKKVPGNEKVSFCHNCLRGQLWPNKMKLLRREVNSKIIHKMESALMVDQKDFEFALQYYDEMFTHELVNPVIEWRAQDIKSCDKCAEKNKAARDASR